MVVGVTGHQSIPHSALPFVEAGIVQVLHRYGSKFTGLSSLAAGADQLFAETVLQMGGHLRVIIPCDDYDSTFEDEEALIRFRHLLDKAETVETLDHPFPSQEAYFEAGQRVAKLSQVLVAVWDGREARGKGGTSDIVRYARNHKIEIVVVWPAGVTR